MSEINGPKININQVNFQSTKKQVNEEPQPVAEDEQKTQLSDFSDPKAEALGRSMMFRGTDDTNNDLKALVKNPQIAENSDEMFETAYKIAQENGIENPYEEAATFATTNM